MHGSGFVWEFFDELPTVDFVYHLASFEKHIPERLNSRVAERVT
jgi:hypothetical protein